jgi:hypothetical protein
VRLGDAELKIAAANALYTRIVGGTEIIPFADPSGEVAMCLPIMPVVHGNH